MGGAQMYISNKIKYLRGLGWSTTVISALDGPIAIDSLNEFNDNIIFELRFEPAMYSKGLIRRVVNRIKEIIGNADEAVIESLNSICSTWGEIIAKEINAKHISFLLDEKISIDKIYYDYFLFKLKRRELAFIKENSAVAFFNEIAIKNPPDYHYILNAVCNNVVEDIIDNRFDEINYNVDYVLCSLGRLTKRYIKNAIDGISLFIEKNPNKKVTCVFIGDEIEDAKPSVKEYISEKIGRFKNVSLYTLGSVYPIPKSFLSHISVGIASAGSANVLYRNNVPTISMDSNDGEAIGVMGYTTVNSLFRENEPIIKLNVLLDLILNSNYLKEYTFVPSKTGSANKMLSEHIDFLNQSEPKKEYYRCFNLRYRSFNIRTRQILLNLIGTKNYIKMIYIRKRIIHSFSKIFELQNNIKDKQK